MDDQDSDDVGDDGDDGRRWREKMSRSVANAVVVVLVLRC